MSTPVFSNPQGSILSVLVPATNLTQYPSGWQTMPLQGVDNGNGTASALTNDSPVQGATYRVTAGSIAPGQTIKNYSGTVTITASPQTINIETVTTGKTYLITDVILTSNDTASGSFLVSITAGGTAILNVFINATTGASLVGIETQPSGSSGQIVALVIPAGTAGKIVAYAIFGIEQ